MKTTRIIMLAILAIFSNVALAGGGGTGGLPGEEGDQTEPDRTPSSLTCGNVNAGGNGLERTGKFELFKINFERVGAIFLGLNDSINSNSPSNWSIDDRRALTVNFSDDGEVMTGNFRALPADDSGASESAKRVDDISVRYVRSTGFADIEISTKNLVTKHTTKVSQQLSCTLDVGR